MNPNLGWDAGRTYSTQQNWRRSRFSGVQQRSYRPKTKNAAKRPGLTHVLQNGANDQSSACETIFEVSTTSVSVLLGSCQSRLQRKWALQHPVHSKPDFSSVAPLILPEVSLPFARLFLAVPVALFWL